MNKLSFLLSLLLLTSAVFAQMPTPPQPNGNIANSTLDKFVGTWRWISGSDTLLIVLKKENILLPFPTNSRADAIIGFHIFKQSGQVIESSINYTNTNYSDKHSTLLGGNTVGIDNPNEIQVYIKNVSKNKSGKVDLIINAAQNQLSWNLKNTPGVKIGIFDRSFSYPLNLTLHRL